MLTWAVPGSCSGPADLRVYALLENIIYGRTMLPPHYECPPSAVSCKASSGYSSMRGPVSVRQNSPKSKESAKHLQVRLPSALGMAGGETRLICQCRSKRM